MLLPRTILRQSYNPQNLEVTLSKKDIHFFKGISDLSSAEICRAFFMY